MTSNAFTSDAVRLEFPSSLGFGASWRPHDTVTLSADFTRTSWSEARIQDYSPDPTGDNPRLDGFTVGTGLILGPMLLDVAYVHSSGEYTRTTDAAGDGEFDLPETGTRQPVRNALRTDRMFASLIYRFSGPPRP